MVCKISKNGVMWLVFRCRYPENQRERSQVNISRQASTDNHAFAGKRALDSVEALTYTKARHAAKLTRIAYMCLHLTIRVSALPLLITIATALSRPAALDQSQVTFEQIPSPNFGRVNAILRDDRGFLWFGTTKGLFKYDGYRVRVFPGSSPEDGLVFGMLKMGDGSLVLGTGNGLWKFDLTKEEAIPFLTGMPFSESGIISLTEDSAGRFWIGTGSHGLFSYEPKTRRVQQYTPDNGLSDNRITVLLPGPHNVLWIGTGSGGLNALDLTTSRIVVYRRAISGAGSLSSDHIVSLCEREERELWIGTDNGLDVLDPATGNIRHVDIPSRIKHTIMSIAKDPAGRMWIAATDLGLLSFEEGKFTPLETADDVGRSLNTILTLYPDPVATSASSVLLWVGTHDGIDKILISTNPFVNHIRGEQSLQLDRGAVLSLCEDRKGILWVGLWGGGLDALQQIVGRYRRVRHFDHDSAGTFRLPANDVGSIMEDGTGNLWIGTQDGLAMFTPDRKHLVVDRHVGEDSMSLANNLVGRVYEDHAGRIWVCTTAGLSQMIPGTPHRFKNFRINARDNHPLAADEVSDVLEDRLANLWVATPGNGLIELENRGAVQQFVFPGDSTGMQENWVYTLSEDHNGLFWLSTRGGLVSFDPRSHAFVQYPVGVFYDEHIFGIAVDRRNDPWLSTSIGLCKFNPESGTLKRYEKDDGIVFTELRSGFFRNAHGRLFVGGLDGFAEFCPDSVSTTGLPPTITITGFSILDKSMPATVFGPGEIDVTYEQRSFSFSFAALDYADPQRNSYAYRMVGLDAGWINAGHRTYASYTNMDPGSYVFEVKGSNSNDVWNEAGTSVRIMISPPYWQTWWFRSALVILFASVTYSAYRYRLRRLLDLERLRLRIADDLHDDVGSNLSAIAMVSRTLQRAPELAGTTRQKLAEIYDTAVLTSEGMKDLVWLIKPENDTLDDLFLRMKDTASTLLGDISFEFHSPDAPQSKTIGIDFKRSVFLAFKEIVTNIAKHSMAGRVEIRIALQDRFLEMVVSDNGTGFDATAHHRGNGLQSLRKRADHIGGSCTITSVPHSGTTVAFSGRM